MVTGDFALTAQAIAAECGIITNPPNMVRGISSLSRESPASTSGSIYETDREKAVDDPEYSQTYKSIVLSGPELITLNENQWEQLCKYDEIVFARTTPEQKVQKSLSLQKSLINAITASNCSGIPRQRRNCCHDWRWR
jgi:sodium/potassium-transporting ATPase subunit alpha